MPTKAQDSNAKKDVFRHTPQKLDHQYSFLKNLHEEANKTIFKNKDLKQREVNEQETVLSFATFTFGKQMMTA